MDNPRGVFYTCPTPVILEGTREENMGLQEKIFLYQGAPFVFCRQLSDGCRRLQLTQTFFVEAWHIMLGGQSLEPPQVTTPPENKKTVQVILIPA